MCVCVWDWYVTLTLVQSPVVPKNSHRVYRELRGVTLKLTVTHLFFWDISHMQTHSENVYVYCEKAEALRHKDSKRRNSNG